MKINQNETKTNILYKKITKLIQIIQKYQVIPKYCCGLKQIPGILPTSSNVLTISY